MSRTFTVAEIAKHFRVPRYKVYGWIVGGELPATLVEDRRHPGAYRVDEADFEEFKRARTIAEGNEPQPGAIDSTHSATTPRSGDEKMGRILTPPEIAKYLRVRKDKVLGWIHSGELKATNVSDSARPRYRIEEADFEDFKLRRSSRSEIPTPRGRPREWQDSRS